MSAMQLDMPLEEVVKMAVKAKNRETKKGKGKGGAKQPAPGSGPKNGKKGTKGTSRQERAAALKKGKSGAGAKKKVGGPLAKSKGVAKGAKGAKGAKSPAGKKKAGTKLSAKDRAHALVKGSRLVPPPSVAPTVLGLLTHVPLPTLRSYAQLQAGKEEDDCGPEEDGGQEGQGQGWWSRPHCVRFQQESSC